MDYATALDRVQEAIPGRFEVARRSKYSVCGVLPDLNGSVIAISSQPSAEGAVVYVEQIYYGRSETEVESIVDGWRTRLSSLFDGTR